MGDYLYGEGVARSVRRLKPVKTEGVTQLRNAHPRSEFIRSLDPLFRPLEMATAPDGTLYIVDMYRGVLEGAPWAKHGTYLRKKIDQYQLDKIVGRGRIWRLTYDGIERDRTQPRMLNETPAQLLAHLTHPNGWWRDMAQQLLVLRQDASVVPALQKMVQTSGNLFARFHALWTLEGLGALDPALVRGQMADPNPAMRVQAVRASETLYKAGDTSFGKDYRALTKDPDTNVVIQAMLTLGLFKTGDLASVIQGAQSVNPARGVQEVGRRLLQPAPSVTFGGRDARGLTLDQRSTLERGATIYTELCATCHGPDGRGTAVEGTGATMAPPLLTSSRVQGHRDYAISTILHGLTGPVDGRTYSEMAAMGTNTDAWVAAVASYVRSGFGGTWTVTPADVARVRAATAARKTPWTVRELEASLPRPLIPEPTWKATASHRSSEAPQGLTFAGWTTGSPQEPGAWFQVELPAPLILAEIQFESPPAAGASGTYPRGFRVQVSMDGRVWSAPVAEGAGSGVSTVIAFPATRARFVRITQTASPASPAEWAVRGLRLFEAPSALKGGG